LRDFGAGVCADAMQSNPKTNVAQKTTASFIGARLCHQQICLASIIKRRSVIRDSLQCYNGASAPTLLTLQRFNFLTTRIVQLAFPTFALRFFYA
jgi:hypothetical protein